jgi:membrane protein YdbS with pleckstrin-like domain
MTLQLLANENVVTMRRQHWITIVPAAVGALVAVIVAIVLTAVLPATVGGTSLSGIKGALVAVIILLAVVALAIKVLRWRFATYTLTNRRIVVSRGVISRITESIALDRVQDTVVRKPLAERLIHAGDVEIESAGRDGVEVLHRIPDPDTFYNYMLQAIEDHRVGATSGTSRPEPLAAPAAEPGAAPPPPPPSDGGL